MRNVPVRAIGSMRLAVMVLIAVDSTQTTAAQELPKWQITPAGGIVAEPKRDQPTTAIGVSVGLRLWRLMLTEAEILRVHDLSPNPSATLNMYWVGGNLLTTFRDSGWRPFALAGAGAGHVRFKQPGAPDPFKIQTRTGAAFNIGGGLIVPVSRRVSVRSDIRWLAVFDGYDDFYHLLRVTIGAGLSF